MFDYYDFISEDTKNNLISLANKINKNIISKKIYIFHGSGEYGKAYILSQFEKIIGKDYIKYDGSSTFLNKYIDSYDEYFNYITQIKVKLVIIFIDNKKSFGMQNINYIANCPTRKQNVIIVLDYNDDEMVNILAKFDKKKKINFKGYIYKKIK